MKIDHCVFRLKLQSLVEKVMSARVIPKLGVESVCAAERVPKRSVTYQ